jgi:hypothetical protein
MTIDVPRFVSDYMFTFLCLGMRHSITANVSFSITAPGAIYSFHHMIAVCTLNRDSKSVGS